MRVVWKQRNCMGKGEGLGGVRLTKVQRYIERSNMLRKIHAAQPTAGYSTAKGRISRLRAKNDVSK
jgi:hypothetical protein